MPVSKPQDIRNIAFLGHGGSGKTTLAEAMLHAAKITGRLGSVADGTSHLDHSDIEKERGHSVDPAAAHLNIRGWRSTSWTLPAILISSAGRSAR